MRPDDIQRLISVVDIARLPDGRVICAVERADAGRDRVVSSLRVVDVRTGESIPLTRGPADSHPVLSPDGSRVAFLRSDTDGRRQPRLIAVAGGESTSLGSLPLGATSLAWSPDGQRLVAVARRPEAGRYGTDPDVPAAGERARRITTANWRTEGVGFVLDRPSSLAVLDVIPDAFEEAVAAPEWRWIDAPAAEWSHARWDADGVSLLAIANAHATRDADRRRDLYRVHPDGTIENLTVEAGSLEVIGFVETPHDGVAVLYRDMGESGRDYAGAASGVALVGPAGFRRLTDLDHDDIGSVGSIVVSGPHSVDARRRRRGRTELVRIDLAEVTVETLVGGDVTVTAHDADANGDVCWASATNAASAELGATDAPERHVLSLPGTPALHTLEEFTTTAADGYPVHGWIAVPDGPGPHPVLLTVHGGPYAQYGPTVADEIQVLVSAGYAVVQCNPRGSAGYGREHARAIRGRLGTDDSGDVLSFLDAALDARTSLDRDRVGIMGGSYGGFLTAWIIAHTSRFRGAIVERGWFDPAVFTGTSDIGSFYADEYVGTDPAAIERQSPQQVSHGVVTPTLVMHSEQDLRCPIGQSERYYTTLRRQGAHTEFVVFPGEGHELTRSGRPRHRIERFEIILDWWARVFADAIPKTHRMSHISDATTLLSFESVQSA